MQTFFVEIKCALGRTYEVASALAEAEIASEIYSIAGDFDILAKFYVERDVDIGHSATADAEPRFGSALRRLLRDLCRYRSGEHGYGRGGAGLAHTASCRTYAPGNACGVRRAAIRVRGVSIPRPPTLLTSIAE